MSNQKQEKELIAQGQHRISQTYLKQFGYKDKDGKNLISVLDKKRNFIENKYIKNFTKEENIFDLPLIDSERKLEQLNTTLETHYPEIIWELKNNGKLSDERASNLLDYFPNLLCRTTNFSTVIKYFLQSDKRNLFFDEITAHYTEWRFFLGEIHKLKSKKEINLVLPIVMDYLSFGFQHYNYIILTNDRGWATCDNPVMFIQNGNGYSLLHTEIEIYFPLSRDFLLYVYHPRHHRENDLLSKHPVKSVVHVNENMAREIYFKTFRHAMQYLIFPVKMEKQPLFNSTDKLGNSVN